MSPLKTPVVGRLGFVGVLGLALRGWCWLGAVAPLAVRPVALHGTLLCPVGLLRSAVVLRYHQRGRRGGSKISSGNNLAKEQKQIPGQISQGNYSRVILEAEIGSIL